MDKKYFYRDGRLRTLERYKEGKLHGEILLYWPNGNLKRRVFFEQGVRHGVDQIWNEAGLLVDETSYDMGRST